ncbi:MAG: hypothetical protein IPM13_09205 [Phycisphaerales bacterium]|nr:hypothetical protein [Phycisphaerales bacterium]
MIVTLDAQRLSNPPPPGCTLQSLIEHVRESHARDRLVVSVALNGQTLSDEELVAGLDRELEPEAQVDFETGTPREVVADTSRALAEAFESSGDILSEAAEALSRGDVPGAMKPIGEYIALWQTTQGAVQQCAELLRLDISQWDVGGRPLLDSLSEAVGKLTLVREALEAKDLVTLGDVVRYELPSLSSAWHDLLGSLAERVESAEGVD